ncbi:hypothetical protein [Neobacillus sp. FSL H8-0543]|uniref:hypothetical protein n=1 Tax=Neobacillus sp. FSL H8-0543 TaxID=2954672 RepID=UPI003158F801
MKKFLIVILALSLIGCQSKTSVEKPKEKTVEDKLVEQTQPLADYSKQIMPPGTINERNQ